jgi:hypothetical protein
MSGGGGYHLNFDVVNFNSESGTKQPTAPKENTIWIDTTWAQNGWSFSADMPLRRSKNKNFVVYPYASGTNTSSGVTFTDNGDGTIKVNGTASKDVYFRASRATAEEGMFLLPAGTYTISGCPTGGSESTYMVQIVMLDDGLNVASTINELGGGQDVTLTKDTLCRMNFLVKSGAKVSNLNVYFQVEKGSSATSFQAGNANGQVWIKTNNASDISFEALKRNKKNGSIVLHPDEVYMYNASGGWNKQKNVKIYQNGTWTAFKTSVYIYNKGNSTGYSWDCDETMKQLSSGHTAADRVTVGSTNVTVATDARAYDFANIFVTNSSGSFVKIDLSKYKTIRIKGTLSGASKNTACVFRALTAMGDLCTENNALSKSFTSGTIDATVDISAVNSSCYLGFTFYDEQITFTLTELWLE